jgi:hypothetical protein
MQQKSISTAPVRSPQGNKTGNHEATTFTSNLPRILVRRSDLKTPIKKDRLTVAR